MKKIKNNIRLIVQILFTALSNGYLAGFAGGKIFQGKSKYLCVPGLSCYSCPGALSACPIGSLQAVLAKRGNYFSFYVLGFLILFGIVLGRFICGFLCPFGLVQDLLYKIKSKKIKVPKKVDKLLKWLKYIILLTLVIIFPMFLTNKFGIGDPFFCKYLCPSGTLFAGIPMIALNDSLRALVGFLFNWKMGILVIILILSVFIYRPFCKYLCPLGAFYGLFNKFALYRMDIDYKKCTNCKSCEKACKMNIEVTKNINSPECIRCGDCKKSCKYDAIYSGFNNSKKVEQREKYTFPFEK